MDSMIRPTRLLQTVSTRALTPRTAIFLAAIMNFIGALTFTGVAGTITKDIVDPFKLHNGLVVVLAAILAAIIWNLLTWFYGIPSSSSHALIGSIGRDCGFGVLHYQGFTKIIIVLIISPIIAFCVGFIMYTTVKIVFKMLTLLERIVISDSSKYSGHCNRSHMVRTMHKINGYHYISFNRC